MVVWDRSVRKGAHSAHLYQRFLSHGWLTICFFAFGLTLYLIFCTRAMAANVPSVVQASKSSDHKS